MSESAYFVYLIVIFWALMPAPVGAVLSEDSSISLSENNENYIIENDYYKAVIPKPSAPTARGIIRKLYIKNATGEWSSNLVMENTHAYGLGYLEGTGAATENRCWGLQNHSDVNLTILEQTSNKIIIEANAALWGTNFTETWTFWAKKPYFRSEASAVVTEENGYLTNQLQFCWMINHNLKARWFGTDRNGDIIKFNETEIQQIHSPIVNTFPWINWQFVDEDVSLGLIFIDIYDRYGTVAETGDWNFEYQLDFELGSCIFGSPVKKGYRREVSTIYYIGNQAANEGISSFAQNHYQHSSTTTEQNPVLQAAQYVNNPDGQNAGLGSALVSAPYFLVRQNTQNRRFGDSRPQYETSIYAPLYKNQQTIHPESWDFQDQLIYSLGYNDGSNNLEYGTINSIFTYNSDYETMLQMDAISSDSKVAYSSTFITWSDSDKLKIEGTAFNVESPVLVNEIYVSLRPTLGTSTYFEAEAAEPFYYITKNFNSFDSLWTEYNYGYDYRTSLIYYDSRETVPALTVPLTIPSGSYNITAYVQERPEGDITYRYSLDNQTWNSFIVSQANSQGIYAAELGTHTITNGTFYIDDDNDASSGIAGWAGWDRVAFMPLTSSISPNVYDFRMYDHIYGELGIAVRINLPTEKIYLLDNSEIRVYLHQTEQEQTLEYFDYPFDIEIYPHKGWLNDASEFTDLHSQDALVYTKHIFYIPEGIHSGRTNTVYSDGAVTYSKEPYNNSSEINMTIIPSSGAVEVKVDTWNTSGTYYKKWIESSTGMLSVSHTVRDLQANACYTVKVDRNILNKYFSNEKGEISFIYTDPEEFRDSDHVFEVEKEMPASIDSNFVGTTFMAKWKGDAKAALSLTFDDNGWKNTRNVQAAILEEYGFSGTFYIITGYSNRQMFKEIFDRGHEIGSHTVTHLPLNETSTELIWSELSESKLFIEELTSAPCISFASPFGQLNSNIRAVAQELYISARGVDIGINSADEADIFNLQVAPYPWPWGQTWTDQQYISNLRQYVEDVIAVEGWGVEMWHDLTANSNDLSSGQEVTETVFRAHLAELASDYEQSVWVAPQGKVA